MKGGARVNSGPPPDPNAIRRGRQGDADTWTWLPQEGFAGAIPDWPLLDDVTLTARRDMMLDKAAGLADELADATDDRVRGLVQRRLDSANERIRILDQQIDAQRDLEQSMWHQLWRTPQAFVWDQQRWLREVAQYVRHKVLAELGSMADAKEARQWSDRLGLNPAAMLRNRWRVVDGVVAKPGGQQQSAPKRESARSRLTVVSNDDDES
ncbi:hypothetical protein [Kibdelosporangium phytohabitans]|uniref:Uncharacterized protein n=1 Tax=Kibdelosporangium phytohabitans TaxID=860235 RepID=A0A0N9HL75_9PSEU|nr:hypothetical protein [Kibdelosporangium phytohabitans]ALG06840.1 hypothetical protein AOZ06_07765 [Kibdelosporangium phytohabitans]MBE1468087.1 hypothetical protein [Kibdelosporangium phytohabitans]